MINGSCPAGCGLSGAQYCVECPYGTYSEGGTMACAPCHIPDYAQFLNGYTGMTGKFECPWQVRCTKDQYLSEDGCTECPDGYGSVLSRDYIIQYMGTDDILALEQLFIQYSKDNVCEPRVFTLTLDPNTNVSWPGVPTWSEKSAFYKYDNGFGVSMDGPFEKFKIPGSVLQPNAPVKKFNGYSVSNNDCTNLVCDSGGAARSDFAQFTENTTLYACWDNLDITITYDFKDKNNNQFIPFVTMNCRVNDKDGKVTTAEGEDCVAVKYLDSYFYVPDGQLFSHYTCKYFSGSSSSGQPCDPEKIFPGDRIPTQSTSIVLEPVFSDCPAGYYCDAGVKTACPMGTTSDAGAKSIDDCEMRGGPNGVKFCDSIGCFTLPAGTVIKPYQP